MFQNTKQDSLASVQTGDGALDKSKVSILIAEDDPDDRLMLKEMLSSMSEVEASFVGDGRELIDCLRSDCSLPSLVLIDLNMPRMSGREALEEIYSEGITTAPIVCMAASMRTESDEAFCVAHGAKTFFAKPSSYDEYSRVLRFVIQEWALICNPREPQLDYSSTLGSGQEALLD